MSVAICSACMAKVEPIEKYGMEICPVCGDSIDAMGESE